jgi:hypothetical protein
MDVRVRVTFLWVPSVSYCGPIREHLMALGSTQPLREVITRNLPGGKGRLTRGADNLNAIC